MISFLLRQSEIRKKKNNEKSIQANSEKQFVKHVYNSRKLVDKLTRPVLSTEIITAFAEILRQQPPTSTLICSQ